jgi:cysteinyl-tRNA synthetase
MAGHYLGEAFDIHGGGADLIFPHHENEIAQSEGATGQPFARYWLHNGMVNLAGEKMSKSTGRLIDLAEAIDRFGGMTLRLFFLRAHYRSPIEFSEELLAAAGAAYQRLFRFMQRAPMTESSADPELVRHFEGAMDNDFSTPEALAVLFEAVTEANRILDEGGEAGPIVAAAREMAAVLGIQTDPQTRYEDEDIVDKLVAERDRARAERDFARSDEIRDQLAEIGVVIEDTADGARWFRH